MSREAIATVAEVVGVIASLIYVGRQMRDANQGCFGQPSSSSRCIPIVL